MTPVTVDSMHAADWSAAADIYRQGIATGCATFETDVPTWEEWDRSHLQECRFVARRAGKVVGWAALTPVSSRAAYRGVAEASVYVAA